MKSSKPGFLLITVILTLLSASTLMAADADEDGLDDAWEIAWFGNTELYAGDDDPDKDGLSNKLEYSIDPVNMNPAHWDTDGDGLDDYWEYVYGLFDSSHLDPVTPSDITMDYDGDGLSTWQEYCGVDGYPSRVESGSAAGGVITCKPKGAEDSLNPLDIDTDYDMLLDSFEAAWYDPDNNIDPVVGAMDGIPLSNNTDTSIAREDSDRDGLTNYREQALLAELREGGVNEHLWVWEDRIPFPIVTYTVELDDDTVRTVRVCLMAFIGSNLDLGLAMDQTIPTSSNRFQLRNHEWTDPTNGTGYFYVDEDIPPGYDSDDDLLPDGWEVEFGLDPRDDGLSGIDWDNGPFGDLDGDGIWNVDEYLGQDGYRSTTDPYINGTGDETNPNRHNWRPDSTYTWRWLPEDAPISYITAARNGSGISRFETLGGALPGAPLTSPVNTYSSNGYDIGLDTDDDGISDADEINAPLNGDKASSPVHSSSPFIPKAVLIKNSAGIAIPDPEPAAAAGYKPSGLREDLQGRDWTIECQVKLLDTDMSGDLFHFSTSLGGSDRTVYRLSLTNNVPVLLAQNNNATAIATIAANELPTDEWVQIAGVWDHDKNTLSLYIHGILQQGQNLFGESASTFFAPATNNLALAASPDGSFVNNLLLDEVRIWGVARTGEQINRFSKRLIPQNIGDDVWINNDSSQYYSVSDTLLVNGGSLFQGEPGSPLENVYSYENSFWIDDGDGQYKQADDILLKRDMDTLVEGAPGTAVANVFWNDKDDSGDFSIRSLLAYYRFDDGGQTAEDFARKAKSGLIGVIGENYAFGDFGYALTSDNFEWSTTDHAPVLGVDSRGADDSDNDGMPDAWEIINHLDPYDDGTGGESAPGTEDGPNGPLGDPDGDGLVNLYEYYSQTNPHAFDTDGDGSPDSQADFDGDGVSNGLEQMLASRPDMVDTDDDGLTDSEEQGFGTDAANPTSPAVARSLDFGGSTQDFVEIPSSTSQRLESWTIEAWVRPESLTSDDQIVLRRVVEELGGGTNALNYVLGLRPQGGELTLFAGYTDLDGNDHILEQGAIAIGEWTHIAATYDLLEATLTLYVNGAEAAVAGDLYIAPPVNGKGGATFTRIGESFDGRIDDLRLWNASRTAAEIGENFEQTLSDLDGLVHYFRFDDGLANEDVNPFGPYHQPQGPQDFVYARDWNEQWIHAGIISGDVQFAADSPIVTPSSLQVIIRPDEAIAAGARWSIDGGPWNESGQTVIGVEPGEHALAFKSVIGWTAPEIDTVTISESTETIVENTYLENGSLTVGLEPLAAIEGGAAWRVEGGEWNESAATLSNLAPQSYYIEFRPVPGWNSPATVPVVLEEGEDLSINRFYTPVQAPISVLIEPEAAVSDGAQWRVDGGDWRASGDSSDPLPYGSHIVEFSDLSTWETPENITVSIESSDSLTVTARYTQTTGVYVELAPSTAAAAGAAWRVEGGAWQSSRTLLELAAGEYRLEFASVEDWTTPAARNVVVSNDVTTTINSYYYRMEAIGEFGGGGVPGLLNSPRGLAFDSDGRLYVADTDNHSIQIYDPATRTWQAPLGSFGSNPGQLNQPMDVFIDGSDNIYIADTGNNRIQKKSAATGAWTVWGGTLAGIGAGEFDGPFGVAVNGSGEVYVADLYNHRVQKRAPIGTWTTIVGSGFSEGQTRFPRDLQILTNGNILLADHDASTSTARIQEFGPTGTYIGLLGGSADGDGGIGKVGAIHSDGTDIYLADMLDNRVSIGNTDTADWSDLMASDSLSSPEGIAYSPAHGLFVADTGNHRILNIELPATDSAASGLMTIAISAIPAPEPEPESSGTTVMMTSSLSTSTSPSSAIELSWKSETDAEYSVQQLDLSSARAEWVPVSGSSPITAENGTTYFIDTNTTDRVKIYRVIKQ